MALYPILNRRIPIYNSKTGAEKIGFRLTLFNMEQASGDLEATYVVENNIPRIELLNGDVIRHGQWIVWTEEGFEVYNSDEFSYWCDVSFR